MPNDYTLSLIAAQLSMLLSSYKISIEDVSTIKDLANLEGYLELYNLLADNPNKNIYDILEGS